MAAFTTFAIISGISAAFSAGSSIASGRAEKRAGKAAQDAANSEADLADFNASVADQQAGDALARGKADERAFDEHVTTILGAQRAAFAGSNVDVNFGTAAAITGDTNRLAEIDRLNIRTNASREAQGYKVEAQDLRQRAVIARRTGVYQAAAGNARATGQYLQAAGSGIGTATSLVDAKYGYRWRK